MKKKLQLVISIFTFICLFLLILIYFEAKILSGVRAYVRGEGMYAKGQKDAVIALVKFVRSKNEVDFNEFEKMLQIPIGDRIARLALEKETPMLDLATEGFLQGQNIKSDIPMMINLFIYFNKIPFMEKSIAIWTEGDQRILELNEVAYLLKKSVVENNSEKINEYLLTVDELNKKLAILETNFSLSIGDGARMVTNILLLSSFSLSGLIFVVLFFYMRHILRAVVKTENDLKENQGKLKNEIDVKNRFFSIIAHDLNNPYNQLLGLTEIMSIDVDSLSKEQLVDFANKVHESALRVFNLQKNLLKWSRIQFTKGEIVKQNVFINELSAETVRVFDLIAQDKGISLIDNISECTVFADPDMVLTVLRNLISNALKFTPYGGKIELFSEKKDNYLQITVSDNGVGMSKEQLESLFALDDLSTSLGTDGEGGTGMGMNLCQEMLKRNDGKIWAESNLGEGTKIHFTLFTVPKD